MPIIQSCIDKNNATMYIEPFVGGANIIDKITCKNKIGSDTNKYLIALFNEIQQNGKIHIPNSISRELYADVKSDYVLSGTKYFDWFKGLVGFCGAFRGKFFDSCACYDYQSQGKIRNNYTESLNNLIKQSVNLKNITFSCLDYKDYNPNNYNNVVFYCDIPYKNTYNYGNVFDYDEFYKWAKDVSKNNYIFISEYDMPKEFNCIFEQEKKMCLQAESKRFTVTEKLFTYRGGLYDNYIKSAKSPLL